MPDANKRTALAVALEYLSLNDYEIQAQPVGQLRERYDQPTHKKQTRTRRACGSVSAPEG